MSTTFPTTLDSNTNLPNPGGTDLLTNTNPVLQHAYQHDTVNDAIKALELKVGVNGSADVNSLDFKIAGTGKPSRIAQAVTTVSLAPNASDPSQTLPFGSLTEILSISTDHPAWIKIYTSTAAQTADAARLKTVDPAPGNGVTCEVTTAAGLLSVPTPAALAYSLDANALHTVPVTITNLDSVARTITLTVVSLTQEK